MNTLHNACMLYVFVFVLSCQFLMHQYDCIGNTSMYSGTSATFVRLVMFRYKQRRSYLYKNQRLQYSFFRRPWFFYKKTKRKRLWRLYFTRSGAPSAPWFHGAIGTTLGQALALCVKSEVWYTKCFKVVLHECVLNGQWRPFLIN